ncbi:MAG: hypothetical protein HRT86_10275 [Ilumatobacteraceae bacterium]|nr:hypothetical protein [Ilumatobacteraceae bacterium]
MRTDITLGRTEGTACAVNGAGNEQARRHSIARLLMRRILADRANSA